MHGFEQIALLIESKELCTNLNKRFGLQKLHGCNFVFA